MNICSWVRGFLQREEKANRTKIKIHILLIKPCISFISFKKNDGNPLHPKGEKSLPLIFCRYWNLPGGLWPPERGMSGREGTAAAEQLTPILLPSVAICILPVTILSRAECVGPGAPGRASPGKLPRLRAKIGAEETQIFFIGLVLLLHVLPFSCARVRHPWQREPNCNPPSGMSCSNHWVRGSRRASVPGADRPWGQSPEHAAFAPEHSVPLRVTNGSFALREALGKSLCQLQLKTVTPTQSYELIIGNPKSPLSVVSKAVPLFSSF